MPASGIIFPSDDTGHRFEPSRFPSLSNTTPLGSNGTYTQPWVDSVNTGFIFTGRTDYLQGTAGPQDVNFVSGSVYADQAGTLYIDQSDDQVNIQSTSIAVSAATLTQIPVQQLTSRYYRFRYVNGATGQGTFVLSQTSERIDAFNQVSMTGNLPPLAPPALTKIIDIPAASFAANTTYVARYSGVTSRNAQARYFRMVNKLNQASNGNCYLVGYDSDYPKPTYAYAGSLNMGAIGTNTVSNQYGSVMATASSSATVPFGPTDSIEIQFPMGATPPSSGNVEVWMVELK